eukprot:629099-Amorphochlora_amoeboformis.AAC.1
MIRAEPMSSEGRMIMVGTHGFRGKKGIRMVGTHGLRGKKEIIGKEGRMIKWSEPMDSEEERKNNNGRNPWVPRKKGRIIMVGTHGFRGKNGRMEVIG